jgi:flagellar M-ring protein FliF
VGTFWNTLKEQFGKIFNRMTPFQRSMVITVTIVTVVTLAAVMMWAGKSDYSILYSGLAGKDAGRIVEKLREMKVDFKLENDGTSIMVPTRKIHELRIEFASLGLPHSGEIGYEVFDKTNIGMTAFVQKLNYHRALEGELARSIAQLDEVESARVHIVIPEPALFEEDKKEATASVIVRIAPHSSLSKRQVQGIAYLVAYSVEGLSNRNVNIVDTNGNILTDYMDNSESIQVTARQLDLQRNVEKYLSEKAQSLLDGVLGQGKSQVRIAVVMDFDQVERTKEMYDPERTAVRSEERNEVTSNAGQEGQPSGKSNEENNVINYEIDKTIEHLVEAVGDVKRISASVLVDGTYKPVTKGNGQEEMQFQERPDAELAAIGDMVKNAIGYDGSRQDQISVLCYPFERSHLVDEENSMKASEKRDFWMAVAEKLFLGLLVIMALLFLRSVVKKGQKFARQMLPPAPQKPQAMLGPERMSPMAQIEHSENAIPELEEEGLTSDALKRSQIQRRVKKYVKENSKEATQLIRTWIAEDTYGAKD